MKRCKAVPAILILFHMVGIAVVFANITPDASIQDPEAVRHRRIYQLRDRISTYIDSLHANGAEEVFTLGKGGNAPQDAIEKMNRVLDGTFRNPEAHRISDAVQAWGRGLRWEFRDLGEPLVTNIIIEKSTHTARCYNGDDLLLSSRIATGNPEIGKDTPEGSYHVIYIDFKPISRWRRGNVPYGHEYNPYGSRQIPFFQDWTMHGNNDASALGKDISKGCVRFHNAEILVIAELVNAVRTSIEVVP